MKYPEKELYFNLQLLVADTLAGRDRIPVLRNTHNGKILSDPRKEAVEVSQILYIVN